jgi:DNA-binding HxlR family transcriptional regulator
METAWRCGGPGAAWELVPVVRERPVRRGGAGPPARTGQAGPGTSWGACLILGGYTCNMQAMRAGHTDDQRGDRARAGDGRGDSGPCPIGRASGLLGDRWILLILRNAQIGVTRFDEFREQLGIADNILSARLRRLVDGGLLVKVPYQDGRRTRQEYRLTQAGADLAPVLRALADWGQRHTTPDAPAEPMRVVHAGCGGEVGPDQACSVCGTRVGRDAEAWVRPWRSPDPIPLAPPVR